MPPNALAVRRPHRGVLGLAQILVRASRNYKPAPRKATGRRPAKGGYRKRSGRKRVPRSSIAHSRSSALDPKGRSAKLVYRSNAQKLTTSGVVDTVTSQVYHANEPVNPYPSVARAVWQYDQFGARYAQEITKSSTIQVIFSPNNLAVPCIVGIYLQAFSEPALNYLETNNRARCAWTVLDPHTSGDKTLRLTFNTFRAMPKGYMAGQIDAAAVYSHWNATNTGIADNSRRFTFNVFCYYGANVTPSVQTIPYSVTIAYDMGFRGLETVPV